jgi:hypothetical protein
MNKNPNLLWFSALILGWLFDLLFWDQQLGANFDVYMVLLVLGGILLLWRAGQPPARGILWLIPPLLFFLGVPLVREEPMTVSLSVLFAILLAGIGAVSYLGGRWVRYSLADYVSGFAGLFMSMLIRPVMFRLQADKDAQEGGVQRSRANLWPYVRGIVIAIPILAIFGGLLASADTIFGKELSDFFKLFFDIEKIPEYIFRLVYILVFAYAIAGAFLHASQKSTDEKLLGVEKPLVPQFLGFPETTIVMGSVIVLFTAFVVVQFRYFFGGQANLGVGGLTDSEYARRGFGELAAVAFLSLLLILGLSTITSRRTPTQRRVFSILSSVLVMLVMVILVSAYQRLRLNEMAHGYFRLRTYSHVFYIWLALLLVAVAILEILHRERAFALAALIAAMGFAVSLTALNVDAFTAQQGVLRASKGYHFNIPDITSLSSDSVPVLADAYLDPKLPKALHEQIGVVLYCRANTYRAPRAPVGDWRSFNFARLRAEQAMAKVQPYLQGYSINKERYPMRTSARAVLAGVFRVPELPWGLRGSRTRMALI